MESKIKKFLHGSFPRYVLVGLGTTLLDFCLFSFLSVVVDIHVVIANIISTIVTVCVSYSCNQNFVFRAEKFSWAAFFSFAGWTLFTGLILQSAIIWSVVHASSGLYSLWCIPVNSSTSSTACAVLAPTLVKPAAKLCAQAVGALANYFGYRYLFNKQSRPQTDETTRQSGIG